MGRLSDRFGRRLILLLSVGGTYAGFLLLAFADPIGHSLVSLAASTAINVFIMGVLFMSRSVDGLTGGNITVAQAYISDITDEKKTGPGGLG